MLVNGITKSHYGFWYDIQDKSHIWMEEVAAPLKARKKDGVQVRRVQAKGSSNSIA